MRRTFPLALTILAAFGNTASGAPNYKYAVGNITVTDLGTLGGPSSAAFGINDLGDIVGYAFDANGKQLPFIHLNGQMLSVYDGATPSLSSGTALAINNSRVVVGYFGDPALSYTRPFYYYPGIWLTPLQTNTSFPLALTWSGAAEAINPTGRIAGQLRRLPQPNDPPVPNTLGACYDKVPVSWPNTGAYPATLFCPTDPNDDGLAEGPSVVAKDINESGNIVGTDAKTSTYSMFLFKNGVRYSVPAPAGLPVLDSDGQRFQGGALGIGNKNWVVGYFPYYDSQQGFVKRAFFWDGVASQSQPLPLMTGGTESEARKVNEARMVIGWGDREYSSGTVIAGFIWHPDFGTRQLPSKWLTGSLTALRPTNCYARAINELKSGIVQAAGYCNMNNGQSRAVRWDIEINLVPVPILP